MDCAASFGAAALPISPRMFCGRWPSEDCGRALEAEDPPVVMGICRFVADAVAEPVIWRLIGAGAAENELPVFCARRAGAGPRLADAEAEATADFPRWTVPEMSARSMRDWAGEVHLLRLLLRGLGFHSLVEGVDEAQAIDQERSTVLLLPHRNDLAQLHLELRTDTESALIGAERAEPPHLGLVLNDSLTGLLLAQQSPRVSSC